MSPRPDGASPASLPEPGVAALHPALPWILALSAAIVALMVVPSTVTMLVGGHSPLPYWDQWNEVTVAEQLSALLGQHNEHRLVFPRLLFALDATLAAGTNVINIGSVALIQLAHALLLARVAGRAGGRVAAFTLFAGFLALATTLSAYQWENLTWGFQSTFVGVYALATAAFAALALLPGTRGLTTGMALAGVAVFTIAQGVLVPVLLVLLAPLTGRRRWEVAVLAAGAAVLLWLFFHGYHRPPPPGGHAHAGLVGLAAYFLAYLGAPFGFAADHLLPGGNRLRHMASVAAGLAGLLIVAALAARLALRRLTFGPAQWVLAFLPLLVLGTAALTTLGRASLGLNQAYSWRYGTPVLLFWCSLALLLWTLAPGLGRLGRRALFAATALLLATLAVIQAPNANVGREIAYRREEAALALLSGLRDTPVLSAVIDDLAFLRRRTEVLREYRLGPFAAPWAGWLATPLADHVSVLPPGGRCIGSVDRIEPLGGPGQGWRLLGWTWDVNAHEAPDRFVVTDEAGIVVGYGTTALGRADVMAAVPQVTSAAVGLRALLDAAPGARLTVHGLVDNTRNACTIPGGVTVP